MADIIEFGLDNYSHLKQRCALHNVTQVPTDDGNASVQMATFPTVTDNGSIESGLEIRDVQKAFSWVIVKYESNRNIYIQAKNQINNSVLTMEPYPEPINGVYPFQALEFTDKDALRWVILLAYDVKKKVMKVYRWREDSNFGVVSGAFNPDSPNYKIQEIDMNNPMVDKNVIYEVFINGEMYEYAIDLNNYDPLTGNNVFFRDKKTDSIPEFVNVVRSAMESLNVTYTTLMSPELMSVFEAGSTEIGKINVISSDIGGDTANAGITFYAGLENLKNLFSALSENTSDLLNYVWTGKSERILDYNGGRPNDVFFNNAINSRRRFSFYRSRMGSGPSSPFSQNSLDAFDELTKHLNLYSTEPRDGKAYYKPSFWDRSGPPYYYRPMSDSDSYAVQTIRNKLKSLAEDSTKPDWLWINSFVEFPDRLEGLVNCSGWMNAYVNGGTFQAKDQELFRSKSPPNIAPYGDSRNITWTSTQSLNAVIAKLDNVINGHTDEDGTRIWKEFVIELQGLIKGYIVDLDSYYRGYEYEPVARKLDWLYFNLRNLQDSANSRGLGAIAGLAGRAYSSAHFLIVVFKDLNNYLNRNILNDNVHFSVSYLNEVKIYINSKLDEILVKFADLTSGLDRLMGELVANKTDNPILDIEALSSMLIAVTNNNRFYFSDAGTFNIQSPNFYSAEYSNSTPIESWRLANRLVLFTNNTVEFWDITNDWRDPMSPAYSSNTYSIQALSNSRIRFNDTLYFIGRPIELDAFSVYSLTKTGQLTKISYPQLDAWFNKLISGNSNAGGLVRDDYIGSVISYANIPILQWRIGQQILNYNVVFDTFFASSWLYFMEGGVYYQERSNKVGSLDNFAGVSATIKTVNTNFGEGYRRYKTVKAFHSNIETGDGVGEDDVRFITHLFQNATGKYYLSRVVKFQTKHDSRSVKYKILGLGLGIDFQTEIIWRGYIKWNNIAYEVE